MRRGARTVWDSRVLVLFVVLGGLVIDLGAGARGAGRGAFMGTIEDFPLMPGLEEDTAAGLVFDSPAGRIVEAFAFGRVTPVDVLDFYRRSLPQLGWSQDGPRRFQREDEVLTIAFPGTGSERLTVRFSLAPRKAAADGTP